MNSSSCWERIDQLYDEINLRGGSRAYQFVLASLFARYPTRRNTGPFLISPRARRVPALYRGLSLRGQRIVLRITILLTARAAVRKGGTRKSRRKR